MDIVFLTVQYISLKMDHKFIPFMKYFKPITKMWSWLDNLKVCRMKVLNLLLYQIIVIIQGWIIVIRLNFGQKLNESLNMLIWPINLIILNITGSLIVLNAMIENENNSFANISIPVLIIHWTWSKERNQNISETILFIFHHGIQHNEVSDYTLHD